MAESYVGQIRAVGFSFVPPGFLPCDGSSQSINDYQELFTLIGTTFGGDGQTTFGLPDLRGRVPVGVGSQAGQMVTLGQTLGSESVTLTGQQVASHSHALQTGPGGTTNVPGSGVFLSDAGGASSTTPAIYGPSKDLTALGAGSIGVSPGGQPHENRQPYLCVNYIICTEGVYPTKS